MGEHFEVASGAARIAGERREGTEPAVVFLHAGVTDRRGWREVIHALPDRATVAYDRPGFGETVAAPEHHSHVGDLAAVLDAVTDGPVWLAGSSQGGRIALDFALAHPARVAGLVLLAPAVSGAPMPEVDELDEPERGIAQLLDQAYDARDLAAVNRYDTWFWLDGPREPEGRVGGPVRDLVLEMNAGALAADEVGPAAEAPPAWDRLGEIAVPTLVAWGDLDLQPVQDVAAEVARRVPGAERWVIEGTAHLPHLERPADVAHRVHAFIRAQGA
jgi:pimeloyl-ACP methyl ester carboxylesterase